MDMPKRFNAAQRLFEIVEKLLKAPHKDPTWKVYISILGEGLNKDDALMVAYELAKLANEIEKTIKSSENVPDEFLGKLAPILTQCRELNLSMGWGQGVGRLKPEAVVALQAYANFFTAVCNEVKLSKEQYQELLTGVEELVSIVDECKHDELREVLLSVLESARRALFLYKINGAKPFVDTYDLALGKLLIQYHRETFSNGENKKTVGKVFQFIHKMRQVCATVNTLLALPSGVADAKKALGLE